MSCKSIVALGLRPSQGPDGCGYEFTGPAAAVAAEHIAVNPALLRLLAQGARLTRRGELSLIGAEVWAGDDGRVRGRPTGLFGRRFAWRLERVMESLNSLCRPIARREGGLVYNLYQPPVPSDRMLRALARDALRRRGERPAPTTCTLQVTTRCQMDCEHCSAVRFKNRDRSELTVAEWRDVVAQSQDLGIVNIVFTGGEPLSHPDLCEIVASVDLERAQPMVFTNGYLLTDDRAAALRDAGLFSVYISIDDPRPEVHDSLRRIPGAFDRAVAGARCALEAGLLVGISTYATPEAVADGRVSRMVELAAEVGVHELTVFDVVPTGRLLHSGNLLSPEDKRWLIELQQTHNAKGEGPHLITQALINGPEGSGCFAGYHQYYMTAFGDVNPCDFTPLTFGNIREESLQAIWARLCEHPAYCTHSDHCRMQDPEFRARYIDQIPDDAQLPWPADGCPARPWALPVESLRTP